MLIGACVVLFFKNKKDKRRRLRREMLESGKHSTKKRCLRADTPPPHQSSWSYFIEREDRGTTREEAWFQKVGLPEQAFIKLVGLCEELWRTNPIRDSNGPQQGDVGPPRPCDLKRRILNCRDTVALVLRWFVSRSDRPDLAAEFGLTDTVSDKYLAFGISILLLVVLRDHARSKIQWKTGVDRLFFLRPSAGIVAPGISTEEPTEWFTSDKTFSSFCARSCSSAFSTVVPSVCWASPAASLSNCFFNAAGSREDFISALTGSHAKSWSYDGPSFSAALSSSKHSPSFQFGAFFFLVVLAFFFFATTF